MQAVLIAAPGEPEVLQLATVPTPKIQSPTEILVELKAAGVNPIDTKLRRRGTFYPKLMPAILGCDGAGIVVAIGTGVHRFAIGDEVYFCNAGLGGHPGNYAEYATVDERFASKKPNSISFVEAAAAPLVLITAWEALYDRGRIEAGMRVLIHAGAGGVGHVAIQLAQLMGASVCTTVSTEQKAEFARSLGADKAIFYKKVDFGEAVLEWTNGEGVELAFDTVGGNTFSQTFPAVQIGGDLVTILEPNASTNWQVARNRNLRISFELMLTPMLQGLVDLQQHQAHILSECAQLIDDGQLKIHVSQVFPLADAAAAHRLLESGSVMGKLVLQI